MCKNILKFFLVHITPPLWINYPTLEEMYIIAEEFNRIQPIHGTILAIDGTHLPIEAPKKTRPIR
jgi:hypothetical protein